MIFKKITTGIKEAFMVSVYSTTARELVQLSDRQLADVGISRELLHKGGKAYPWRADTTQDSQVIPFNVALLKPKNVAENAPSAKHRPRAA